MNRIYLLGFMGTGKSTIGAILARKMEMEFIDLDDYIEKISGLSIQEIFETGGEASFRKLEQKCLYVLSERDNLIIATGGGTPCHFQNMRLIKNSGVSIYLNCTAEVIYERLYDKRATRPLISNKSDDELKRDIINLLSERRQYYEQSDIIVNAHAEPEEIVKDVNRGISKIPFRP